MKKTPHTIRINVRNTHLIRDAIDKYAPSFKDSIQKALNRAAKEVMKEPWSLEILEKRDGFWYARDNRGSGTGGHTTALAAVNELLRFRP